MNALAKLAITLVVLCLPSLVQAQHYTLRFLTSTGYPRDVRDLVFSPQNDALAVSVASDKLYVVSLATGEIEREFSATPLAVSFSGDGRTIVGISERGTHLFHRDGGEIAIANWGLPFGSLGLEIERRGGKIVVSSLATDGPAKRLGTIPVGSELVGVRTPQRKFDLLGRSLDDAMEALAGPAGLTVEVTFIPPGKRDQQSAKLTLVRVEQTGGQQRFLYDPRSVVGRPVAYCVSNSLQVFIDAQTGNVNTAVSPVDVELSGQRCVSPDYKLFAIVAERLDGQEGSDYAIEVFDLKSQQRTGFYPYPYSNYYGMRFAGDAKRLYIGGRDRVHVLDCETGKFLDPLYLGWHPPTPNELAAADKKKVPSLFKATAQAAADSLAYSQTDTESPKQLLNSFDVSIDGKLAVGDPWGKVTLWPVDGSEKSTEVEPAGEKTAEFVTFSPDGKWLAYYIDGTLSLQYVPDLFAGETSEAAAK